MSLYVPSRHYIHEHNMFKLYLNRTFLLQEDVCSPTVFVFGIKCSMNLKDNSAKIVSRRSQNIIHSFRELKLPHCNCVVTFSFERSICTVTCSILTKSYEGAASVVLSTGQTKQQ
jgi:hypothetical protein